MQNAISEIHKSVVQIMYDIIKAHGGEIKVETKEGESAEVIFFLPFKEK